MTYGFPFPIPNGWFQVAWAHELAPLEVRPLRYFGRDLVLFRGEGGRAGLLDAFCPHLGAHLGHGGRVEGGSIRCPFHAWQFDAEGVCTAVPYAKKIPAKATIRPWALRERNGILWAHHHLEGRAPTWEVPEIPEAISDDWTDFECHDWIIRTTPQEIGENGVDRAHFRYVHGTPTVPDSEARFEGHIRNAAQHLQMETPRGTVKGTIEVNNHGLGCTITRFSGIADTVVILSHAPIDAMQVHTRFSFTQPKVDGMAPKGGAAKAFVREIIRQLQEDIPIWENKIYAERPILCDEDGPIGQYRRWATQFYSPAS